MKKLATLAILIFSVIFLATSCSQLHEISAEELEQIVQRDGVTFDVQSIPDEVLDSLAAHRVVVVGEIHHLYEHRELIAELVRKMHSYGFRQLLFEWTQVADWLLDDFVLDKGLEPEWAPPEDIGGAMIIAIRDFNRTLPENERIRVRPIDVTLPEYGGSESFQYSLNTLAGHLADPGPLSVFLDGNYDTPEKQTTLLKALQIELENGRSDLIYSWGEYWYDTVSEIVEIELASVPIRAIRQSNYDKSVRLREDVIKRLVDRRLQGFQYGTLINIGSTHAQKERLWGNKIEWLGDYLVHQSQDAGGSVIVLDISAAYIVSIPESGIPDYDLKASPENELFRVMNQIWPDRIIFLPMDNPAFIGKRVPLNVDGVIHLGSPKRHFDTVILLPLAHRVPAD